MEELKKKYNFGTAIAMIVGIVIGAGIFFKTPVVLSNTNGNLSMTILAFIIGGIIMLSSVLSFSIMAQRVSKNNGLIDYIEASTNKKITYYVGWYSVTIYYPVICMILSYITSVYFLKMFGINPSLEIVFLVAFILLTVSIIINILSPKIAGYLQTSATVIKMIPILILAIGGLIYGLVNNSIGNSFTPIDPSKLLPGVKVNDSFGRAIMITVFCFEGWIIATSINGELKNSKKNLPRALIIGSIVVVSATILYNIGISSLLGGPTNVLNEGNNAPIKASELIFGPAGPYILGVFIFISCYGGLNGVSMATIRGMYSLSVRGEGILVEKTKNLHPKFNISIPSAIIGYGFTIIFLVIFYLSLKGILPFGEIDELCIAFLYISHLFIYIHIMKTYKDLNIFMRFIIPSLSIVSALFITIAASGLLDIFVGNGPNMLIHYAYFVLLVVIFFLFAYLLDKKNNKKINKIKKGGQYA